MKRTKPILLCLCSLFLAVSVGAQTFVGADVGTPALAGSVTGTAPGIQTIVGGGDDIWNQSDNFYYVYTSVTGQVWDARVRVHDLQGPDHWSKCELMVRVPDATGIPKGPDPFFAAMTTRAAGQNQVAPQWRPTRGGSANWDAMGLTIAPTYPNPHVSQVSLNRCVGDDLGMERRSPPPFFQNRDGRSPKSPVARTVCPFFRRF